MRIDIAGGLKNTKGKARPNPVSHLRGVAQGKILLDRFIGYMFGSELAGMMNDFPPVYTLWKPDAGVRACQESCGHLTFYVWVTEINAANASTEFGGGT